jgi:hypothetical protein
MSNGVTDQTADNMSDVAMESPEKLDKGKGKAAAMEQDPMDDEEGSSEEDEEVNHPQTKSTVQKLTVCRPRTKVKVNSDFTKRVKGA